MVSEALRKISIKLGVDEKKIRVIPNGVDPEKFLWDPSSGGEGKSVLLRGPVIGFIGVSFECKQKLTFYCAHSHLLSKSLRPSFRSLYVVVGEG